jgi:hypothetical protein
MMNAITPLNNMAALSKNTEGTADSLNQTPGEGDN